MMFSIKLQTLIHFCNKKARAGNKETKKAKAANKEEDTAEECA